MIKTIGADNAKKGMAMFDAIVGGMTQFHGKRHDFASFKTTHINSSLKLPNSLSAETTERFAERIRETGDTELA